MRTTQIYESPEMRKNWRRRRKDEIVSVDYFSNIGFFKKLGKKPKQVAKNQSFMDWDRGACIPTFPLLFIIQYLDYGLKGTT